jgi:hypothetical protein
MFGLSRYTRRSGYIPEGKTEVIKKSKGNPIRCSSGILWVTIEGDSRDYRLSPLQELPIPNQGMVVLSGPASYQVSAVQHPIRSHRAPNSGNSAMPFCDGINLK